MPWDYLTSGVRDFEFGGEGVISGIEKGFVTSRYEK